MGVEVQKREVLRGVEQVILFEQEALAELALLLQNLQILALRARALESVGLKVEQGEQGEEVREDFLVSKEALFSQESQVELVDHLYIPMERIYQA